MLRWIVVIVGMLVAIALAAVTLGAILPREHRATSRLLLRTPVDTVWAVVRDLERIPAWWTDVKQSRRLPDQNGHEAWQQVLGDGTELPLEVVESDPPHRLRTVIASTSLPFGGEWIYELTPMDGGTQLTITEDGWVSNPAFRLVSRAMGHHHTLDQYLGALAARLGEAGRPEHIQ